MHSFDQEPLVDTDVIHVITFPHHLCILEMINNWMVGRAGNSLAWPDPTPRKGLVQRLTCICINTP